jgi:hypothetical protein
MEARAIAYADDGYIKTKLNVTLQVLAEFPKARCWSGAQRLQDLHPPQVCYYPGCL